MADDVPRRMRRFYRGEKPTEQEVKKKSTELAIKEVDKFKQENNRYPAKEDLDIISENVFDQLKREIEIGKAELKRQAKEEGLTEVTGPSKDSKGKSFLDIRREKRGKIVQEPPKAPKGRRKKQQEEEEQIEEPEFDESEFGVQEPVAQDEDSQNVQKLAALDEISNLEENLDASDDNSDLVDKEIDSDLNICPRCNTRTDELLYCPSCGEAFCDHCAKAVDVQGETVKYTCPKCGKDFKKSKSRQ